ncbi:MAG: hypothetical protein H8E35_09715, partial [Ardenticatenia bacterium]|nr:hypothetical protein [Ardenticatenia bacterium]
MGRVENIFRLRWQISRDTGVAFASGLAVIALSTLLLPFRGTAWEGAAFFILRDLAMDFGFGFVLPVAYTLFVEGQPLAELGLTTRRWVANLAVNIVLAVLLAFIFASEAPPEARLTLTPAMLGAVFYILVAGI